MYKLLLIVFLTSTSVYAQDYHEIKGRVFDNESKEPIPFAHIYIKGSLGNISNDSGAFLLHIPKSIEADSLYFSCLGYKSESRSLQKVFVEKELSIYLNRSSIQLLTAEVFPEEAKSIFRKAIERIPENYGDQPYRSKVFQRSTTDVYPTEKMRDFVENDEDEFWSEIYQKYTRESVLQARHISYDTTGLKNQYQLLAWRNRDENRIDSVESEMEMISTMVIDSVLPFTSTGAESIQIPLDFIRVLYSDYKKDRDYNNGDFELLEIVDHDEGQAYHILLNKKEDQFLIKAHIYIDTEDYAIIRYTHNVKIRFSGNYFFLSYYAHESNSICEYKKVDGFWTLSNSSFDFSGGIVVHKNFVSKLIFRKWPRKLKEIGVRMFYENEIACFDVERSNSSEIPEENRLEPGSTFNEELKADDDEIWMNFSVILPNN